MAAQRPFRRRSAASIYLKDKYGLSYKTSTLAKLATIGGGPPFVLFGRWPLYTDVGLDKWVEDRLSDLKASTSDREPGGRDVQAPRPETDAAVAGGRGGGPERLVFEGSLGCPPIQDAEARLSGVNKPTLEDSEPTVETGGAAHRVGSALVENEIRRRAAGVSRRCHPRG